jgi:hypothetical protein
MRYLDTSFAMNNIDFPPHLAYHKLHNTDHIGDTIASCRYNTLAFLTVSQIQACVCGSHERRPKRMHLAFQHDEMFQVQTLTCTTDERGYALL